MAVGTADIALGDFFLEGVQTDGAGDEGSDIVSLDPSDVVEVQNQSVLLPAINARMITKMCPNVTPEDLPLPRTVGCHAGSLHLDVGLAPRSLILAVPGPVSFGLFFGHLRDRLRWHPQLIGQ